MKKIVLLKLSLFAGILSAFGQLTVGTGMTAQQYVENILIGSGVTVSNVTFSGNNNMMGSFNGSNSNIGFQGGVVLVSGNVNSLPGSGNNTCTTNSNVSGDASLLSVAQSINPGITSSSDAAILEFDFVPTSSSVTFNFVFASEEYEDQWGIGYEGTEFNDVFGFFLSGPDITGPYAAPGAFPGGAVNLALIPGTNIPITISTINATTNSEYFLSNIGGGPNTHAMNGFTVPIPISFPVHCDSTYHFKFAVADCQDATLNTAVYLQENSFTSPPVEFAIEGPENSETGSIELVEGCLSEATVYFTRSLCQSDVPITVTYSVSGSATEGVDFEVLQNPITLPAGEDSAAILVTAIADAIPEGIEYIVISYSYVDEQGETITTQGSLSITDPSPLVASAGPDIALQCEGLSATLNGSASGGATSDYTYSWSPGGATTAQLNTGPLENGTYEYILTVTGACNLTDKDTVIVTMNQTLAIDTIMIFDASACASDGAVSAMVEGQTGTIDYNWTGNGFDIDASVLQNIPAGTYNFTAVDDVCTVTGVAVVEQDSPPMAAVTASPTSGCSPLAVTFTNGSQNSVEYNWDLGNGQNFNTNNLDPQTATYTDNATIRLIAINGNCRDTAFVSVSISTCGCTDPTAINYNPAATVSTGGCIYPEPQVIVPNIFTPNGDGDNDLFILTTVNAESIDLVVTDRWGVKVYEGSGASPAWNGLVKSGAEAEEGVYFYTYTVKGLISSLEGHGFLHLMRD